MSSKMSPLLEATRNMNKVVVYQDCLEVKGGFELLRGIRMGEMDFCHGSGDIFKDRLWFPSPIYLARVFFPLDEI